MHCAIKSKVDEGICQCSERVGSFFEDDNAYLLLEPVPMHPLFHPSLTVS